MKKVSKSKKTAKASKVKAEKKSNVKKKQVKKSTPALKKKSQEKESKLGSSKEKIKSKKPPVVLTKTSLPAKSQSPLTKKPFADEDEEFEDLPLEEDVKFDELSTFDDEEEEEYFDDRF